jgi:hypothetical protein
LISTRILYCRFNLFRYSDGVIRSSLSNWVTK